MIAVLHLSPTQARRLTSAPLQLLGNAIDTHLLQVLQLTAPLTQTLLLKLISAEHLLQCIKSLIMSYEAQHHGPRLELLYSGSASPRTIVHELRDCKAFTDYVASLIATTTTVVQALELEVTAESQVPPLSTTQWKEHILSLHSQLSSQISCLNYLYQSHELAWNSYQQIRSIRASEGVTRLTVLAAIFLPLSLASSMLAMDNRLVDLHLRLFDFVGIFFVLSSIAFLAYLLIIGLWTISRAAEEAWSKACLAAGRSFLTRHGEKDKVAVRLLWAAVLACFVLLWFIVTSAFVVGMVDDVILGMRVLGFAVAGWVAVVSVLVLCLVRFYWEYLRLAWRLP